MKIVYRYETLNANWDGHHYGPYDSHWKGRNLLIDAHQRTQDFDSHPCITRDLDNFENSIDLCACTTIRGLKQWFRLFNSKLLKSGFVMVKYKVKTIKNTKSKRQVAFNKNKIITREIINKHEKDI